ncbi:hypothetical protein [Enterococcus sp. AZ102]|uniref:hypothetical protein n=1 Tax=Enterococcus sp. AZ102 TaxID=2774865 RepID=UPI003F28B34F
MNELYSKKEIVVLLENYYSFDDLKDEKIDLDIALESEIFSGKERLFLALSYALELNFLKVMKLSNFYFEEIEEVAKSVFEKLEAVLNGYKVDSKKYENYECTSLDDYIKSVQTKHINIFKLSYSIRRDLLVWLALDNEDLALSALGLKVEDEWLENVSKNSKYYYEVPSKKRKNSTNDELYRQDLNNSVTYYSDFYARF